MTAEVKDSRDVPGARPLTFHLAHEGAGVAWPGDPNAIFFWEGVYHFHYIYDRGGQAGVDPFARFHAGEGDYAFAHLSSTDLVHWTRRRTTLNRDVLGHGTFSGTGFITRDGRPAIIYHGEGSGTNQVVIAQDDALERWSAPAPAVVRVRPGQDPGEVTHGDPDAWLDGEVYYAIFGGQIEGRRPATLLRSADLQHWEYLGLLLDPDLPEAADDTDVSCANFFPIGNKHMLLCISHNKGCRYYLGEWKNEKFTPEVHGRMNWHAQDFFAPESVLTPDGRRVMWAWAYLDAPHSGIQCLPRELDLPEDGVLRIRPLRELQTLRTDPRTHTGITVAAGDARLLPGFGGDALELAVTIRPGTCRRFGIAVHCNPQGRAGIPITVDRDTATLSIGDVAAPFELTDGEDLHLRIFLDQYLLEAFANDRQAILSAHFTNPDHHHITIFATNADITADVTAWRMNPIQSPAHLTDSDRRTK